MNFEPTLEHARRRDEADPLRGFRECFALPRDERGEPLVYLCGHSLGLQPLEARRLVLEELDDWARLGVLGHEDARRPWIGYHEHFSAGLSHVTGAREAEVVAMNSLTANLHFMLASFYRPSGVRRKILIEAGAFPSDRYAVASHIEWHGLDPASELLELGPRAGEDLIDESAIEACLDEQGAEIALVLWPGVQYLTGQSFDLARIVRAAQRAGSVVGVDLAHSIGNVPLALHDVGTDFAVWCSYKYLNAGPGAIGGAFVHEHHAAAVQKLHAAQSQHAEGIYLPRLTGWWGNDIATRFLMRPELQLAMGAQGWQVSNPPVLAAAPLLASLAIFQEAGIDRLREKSLQLTGFLAFLLERLRPDVQLITPARPEARGAQLSLRIGGGAARGKRVFDRLSLQGIVCDWREPDTIRVAAAPLYNRFEDAFVFHERLAQALQETA